MATVHAKQVITISELKQNPTAVIKATSEGSIAVLNRSKPIGYVVSPEDWEDILLRRDRVKGVFDMFTESLRTAPKDRLRNYIKEKGWKGPNEVARLLEYKEFSILADGTTRSDPIERDDMLLAVLAVLPSRKYVLLPDELSEQEAILESGTLVANIRKAAVRLFYHACTFSWADKSILYFHVAKRSGAEISQEWIDRHQLLHTLLGEEEIMEMQVLAERYVPEPVNVG